MSLIKIISCILGWNKYFFCSLWNNYKNIQKKELTFCRDNENIKLINYTIIVLKSQTKSNILTKYKKTK